MLSEKALEVKKYLEDFNQSKRKLRSLKDELKELLELGALPRVSDGNMPGAKGGYKSSNQEKFYFKLEQLQEKITEAIDIALQKEHEFLDAIKDLDVLSQNLLMERYMQGKPLKKIINDFHYSESTIIRNYNKAFETLGSQKEDS